MKPILLLILMALLTPPQQQVVAPEEPDLSVIKFSWAKERQNSSMIRGAQRPGGPITTPMPSDARDHQSRRADIRNMEKKAEVSGQLPQGDRYHMRLEVKNTGTNVVRNLIWEFRPTSMPDDYEPKQYLCMLRVKPKEKKILDLWTPYAPVKVVRVDVRADALKDGEVVINKIEYEGGAVWKRRDWYYSLPADAPQRLSEGQCSVF